MEQALTLGQLLPLTLTLTVLLFTMPLATVKPQAAPPLPPSPRPAASAPAEAPAPCTIRVLHRGEVQEMDLEDYLLGVVRAEMPASFHLEALKAQAVSARSYTLYQMAGGGRHSNAHICTDPACCQAWISEADARKRWGEKADAYCAKTAQAVRETAGEVLLYEGEPILAAFHAASPPLTRPAGEVWGRDVPYLQSVSSPETLATCPGYYDSVILTPDRFREKAASLGIPLSGPPESWLTHPVTDGAGSVRTVDIGGVTVTGTKLRSLLGLRSACFVWETGEDRIAFTTTGSGHGVGMSQYGAHTMAVQGKGYRDILSHYYPGTVPRSGEKQLSAP